ncbi:hypothetical protein [Planomonospora parontospora]|uniref:hypothetical protein n=1 Tax=Planomonospora parontospora TaxID=58119 RepID=UPI00166FACCE|nr:hypothetical protein [Planomonospora parontospora]GGL43521.1 hypothetical protein GCM10014719_51110 [Planomonospora parontospora subsp. antibiotica]GII18435.1 hypothetical protein Ppa05_51610 [Planomonospora parontospora subsp. antibiotica]
MASQVTRLYQAVLRDREPPISIRLRRTFSEWTEAKGFPPASAARARTEHETGGARLVMERRGGGCGRYTLDEPLPDGTLRTQVTYAESVPGMTGWVVVTVEQHGGREPEAVTAPGFLPAYLRTARITDGAVHVEDAPVVLDETEVDRFVRTLADPRRRVPAVVVSVDAQRPEAARARADHLAAALTGAALVARLADLRSQDRFNEVLGERLGVYGGGVRTYVTPFDPAGERYPERHLTMGGPRLRAQGTAALGVVVDGALGRTARAELPGDVRRTMGAVRRVLSGTAELGSIAAAAAPVPAPVDLSREELRRGMMALTRQLVPPATLETASETASARSAAVPPSTVQSAVARSAAAGPGAPGTAAPGTHPAAGQGSSPAPSPAAGPVGDAPALDVAGLVRAVADAVVKELRGELESALNLAASSASPDDEPGRLLREIRVLGAHVAGLRDVVAERWRDGLPPVAGEAGAPADTPAETRVEDEPGARTRAEGGSGAPAETRVEGEAERLRREHLFLQKEYADSAAEARRLAWQVRRLERMLAEAGHPAYGAPPEEDVFEPTGLVDVLVRARATLRHVSVGDTDGPAARLDLDHPALCRTWAAKAWDALCALDDFAGARSSGAFSGGFYDWCANGADGRRTIPTGMLAMRESRSVTGSAKFSEPRVFTVPQEVHPAGRLLMEAHVKLRPVGYPAPRMYFHDDSGGASGKVWIGYLGDHLPNTRTN